MVGYDYEQSGMPSHFHDTGDKSSGSSDTSVVTSVQHLDETVEKLAKILDMHFNRLQPVLADDLSINATRESEKEEDRNPDSMVVQRIEVLRKRVNSLISQVILVNDRVQL